MRRNTSRRQSTTQKQFTIRRYGIHQGLRWSFRGWHKNGIKDAARSPAVRTLSKIRQKNKKRPVSRWPRLSCRGKLRKEDHCAKFNGAILLRVPNRRFCVSLTAKTGV